ncbi:hypothetical protein ACHAWF_002063 [Thalassiosira exigua]
MESAGYNATSPSLFDHSFANAPVQSNRSDAPLSDFTSTTAAGGDAPVPRGTPSPIPFDFSSFLFFAFPVLGFVILVAGSCFLRKRLRHQERRDEEARSRHRARLRAAEHERKAKAARRSRMVERALVTTKVASATETKAGRFAARERCSSAETDATMDATTASGASGTDLETTASSLASGGDRSGDELSEAEQGQHVTISPNNSTEGSATARSPGALLGDDPGSPVDWEAETCAICLEGYRAGDDVSYSRHRRCRHVFHASCIVAWLNDEGRDDCPYCRGPYLRFASREDDDVPAAVDEDRRSEMPMMSPVALTETDH